MEEKRDIKSLTKEELTAYIKECGYPAYRGGQLYDWMHRRLAERFDQMNNLPGKLREELEETCTLRTLTLATSLSSADGQTVKYLFRLEDGHMIESVWMKYHHGVSVCISSQVGCRMGCRFCASTLGGKVRDLTASEMLDQVYRIQQISGERVSHVVVMGTGEPLDNYDNLLKFIRLLTAEEGLHISQRNITVSTCGLLEQMDRLATEGLQITLALSLHASEDEERRRLMPIAKQYQIKELLRACDRYLEKTGRRISFEYSLIAGENDSPESAERLSKLLAGKNCHVNLIPVNPIKERNYRHSAAAQIMNFKNILENNRINVTIRREMGADINAACGQLRRDYIHQATSQSAGEEYKRGTYRS